MAGRKHPHPDDRPRCACFPGRNRAWSAGVNAEVITFGCRLNAYESAAIRKLASDAGLQGAIIFNTCAVTAEAVRQSRQAIRKVRRAKPDATIIVTGCAAQIEPQTYS